MRHVLDSIKSSTCPKSSSPRSYGLCKQPLDKTPGTRYDLDPLPTWEMVCILYWSLVLPFISPFPVLETFLSHVMLKMSNSSHLSMASRLQTRSSEVSVCGSGVSHRRLRQLYLKYSSEAKISLSWVLSIFHGLECRSNGPALYWWSSEAWSSRRLT